MVLYKLITSFKSIILKKNSIESKYAKIFKNAIETTNKVET